MKKVQIALIVSLIFILSSIAVYAIATVVGDKIKSEPPVSAKDGNNNRGNEDTINDKEDNRSPLSGLYTDKEISNVKPVAIMFDNHPGARWQAGLNQAEIVYEIPVEGPYTRYVGVYLINEPENIGPVRSTRPYFVETILQYDPVYVRCGGSEEGKAYVKRYGVSDIDGLVSNSFWRSDKKKAPHNLYTSMQNIRKEQEKSGHNSYRQLDEYKFYKEDTDIDGNSNENVLIKYNKDNETKYAYNSTKKVYERYKDGSVHIDENDSSTITAKNIIIQKVNTKVIDDEGRKKVDVVGSGSGIYITNGKSQEINWRKNSANDKTIYTDKYGLEIDLNPGITWIQLVPMDAQIEIN